MACANPSKTGKSIADRLPADRLLHIEGSAKAGGPILVFIAGIPSPWDVVWFEVELPRAISSVAEWGGQTKKGRTWRCRESAGREGAPTTA